MEKRVLVRKRVLASFTGGEIPKKAHTYGQEAITQTELIVAVKL